MPQVRDALRVLDLGSSVAEFDKQLESYFVETQPFLDIISDRRDIIAGDKGTGKTAIFSVLHKRYHTIQSLKNTIVIPAFNPSGNPIFQELASKGVLEEGEYIRLWKAYILGLVGNWILRHNRYKPKSNLAALDSLLRGMDIRSEVDGARPIFEKILQKIGSLFNWKSVELKLEVKGEGFSFAPKVDLSGEEETVNVSVEQALSLVNQCLADIGKKVWVAFDRLDEAFQGYADVEIPALRALLRTYLDMEEFGNVTLKLFLRRDLFARVVKGGFVNLTHINARKIELIWDEDDLKTLLCRRIRQNESFVKMSSLKSVGDERLFDRIFPAQVDQGSRKAATWVWMMSRIADGNRVKPPRNLIDLVSFAREAQLRREDRTPRNLDPLREILEPDALRAALTQLSETRVTDTLLAEAKNEVPLIEKFRKGKSEHNKDSLAKLLAVKIDVVEDRIQPLLHIGFLEPVGTNYKVPILYRSGLEITQGKAVGVKAVPGADNDE